MKEAGGVLMLISILLMGVAAILGIGDAISVIQCAATFSGGLALGLIGAAMIDRGEYLGH